jgi:hypothetical protein
MLSVVQKSHLKATGTTDCLEWERERVGLEWDFGVLFFFLDFSFLGFLFQRRETEGDNKIPSRCFHTLLVRERNREKGDVFSLFFVLAYVKDLKSLRKANEYDFFGIVNLFI